jgi:hypothetical protein
MPLRGLVKGEIDGIEPPLLPFIEKHRSILYAGNGN